MRFLFSIFVLLLSFSCSQVKELIAEYSSKFEVLEDRARLDERREEEEFFFMACVEESATIDSKQWEAYLIDNLILDDSSLDSIPPGTYEVFIRFVIDKKGKISDVSIIKIPLLDWD